MTPVSTALPWPASQFTVCTSRFTRPRDIPAFLLGCPGGASERRPILRRTQEGCGGLGGENPAAFPQARPIFQQPFSLPESAQTLAGIAFRAAGKSVRNFPAASKFARKLFQQGISDSHSLLEFSEIHSTFRDTLWEQFCLSDQSALIDASLWRKPL